MLKSGQEIREAGVFTPFSERIEANPSAGLSAAGYDIRLDNVWKFIKHSMYLTPFDPARLTDEDLYWQECSDLTFDLVPGGFVLAQSLEYIRVPPTWLGVCVGKSTWARGGLLVNVTPLEPGWEGHLTLELHNIGQRTIRLREGAGITQIIFMEASVEPSQTYAARLGRYQGQLKPTVARSALPGRELQTVGRNHGDSRSTRAGEGVEGSAGGSAGNGGSGGRR